MGIQGLQSFVKTQCSSDAWHDVDFKELGETGERLPDAPMVLVVDAMSCLKHFYGPNTDWVCGGQWNELLRNVETFVSAFRQLGIELVVFFDGEQDSSKIQSWLQEEEESRQLVRQILTYITASASFPPKRQFFVPKSTSTCLRLAFRCRDVVVCSTVADLHQEVVNYCKKHHCAGILGYHSDYLLLHALCYYSASHLKVIKNTTITTVKFNIDVIFRELELDKSRWALFSSLLGNSFIPEQWLAQFHWSLLGPDHPLAKLQAQVGKQFILPPYDVVIRSVAKFVHDLEDPTDLTHVMSQVLLPPEVAQEDFLQRLSRSIAHYKGEECNTHVLENGQNEIDDNYPVVTNVAVKVDVLSSPSNGTSESNYQKRWQHWQQHQYLSDQLLQTTNNLTNGISPTNSELDVGKLTESVGDIQLEQLELDKADQLSPTRTLSAPDTPSTPTQQSFAPTDLTTDTSLDTSLDTTPSGIMVFSDPTTDTSENNVLTLSTNSSEVNPSPTPSTDSEPTPSTDSEPTPSSPPTQPPSIQQTDPVPVASDCDDEKCSNEKSLSSFYAFISPEVLKTAKKRHQSGQMMEMVYQVLSKGEIKIGIALEDENAKGRSHSALLYRGIRQRIYGILLDKKLYDSAGAEQPRTPPPSVREWCMYGSKKLEKPDMVEPVSLDWDVPPCKQLWLGTDASDNSKRLKAFLSCMLSDSPGMVKTTMVPQRCVILCCVLRYLIQKQGGHAILRPQELEAFLAQALSPHLTTECNVTNLSQIKVNKVDTRGVQLATIFMRGVECAIFANDACGSPIPWDLVCPWNYFDGKLFQSKLNMATTENSTLSDLCDGNSSRMEKVERMKWCIMEGLGQDFMLNGLPSNRNASNVGLLPSPFFGPIPPHMRNAPLPSMHFTAAGASALAYQQQKARGRGSKRPVSGLGGTLQVAGVPVAKFQGNRAGRGYNPNQQVVVGGRSSVDIAEPKSSIRGRGSRVPSAGRAGVSWAPEVDKDYERNPVYPGSGQTAPSTNLSQVHDVIDPNINYSPKQSRMKKRGLNKPPDNKAPMAAMNIPGGGDMTPMMPPPRVPMQDPNQMFAKMPAHFGTMAPPPRGRTMMMDAPRSNMSPPQKNHMMNPALMGGVNPVHGIMPGLGMHNPHDKAMMGRGWWWERMKQHHP